MQHANEWKALELIRVWRAHSEAVIREAMALSDLQDEQCEYLLAAISDNAPDLVAWEEKLSESDPVGDRMDAARDRYEEANA